MKISSRVYSAAVLIALFCLLGLWVMVCLGCASVPVTSEKRLHLESWYTDALAKELNADAEARMRNGTRCDVLATHHAIEVEFAAKWCEAIGQALNYASQTGRRGTVALILEKDSDERFLTRLRDVVAWHQLPISVIVLRPFGTDSLTIELPSGFPAAVQRLPDRPRAVPVDLRRTVDAMDWIPRVRGTLTFEIATTTKKESP